MNKKYKFVFMVSIVITLVIGGSFFISHYYFREGVDPFQLVKIKIDYFRKNLKILFVGRDAYIDQEIKKQYKPRKTVASTLNETQIGTSLLPLKSTIVDLLDFVEFPDQGGSLVKVGSQLLILDRMGIFYKINGKSAEKLNFPKIPNLIESYILSQAIPVGNNIMRAISSSYDEVNNVLYVGYTKRLDNDFNCYAIAYLHVDQNLHSNGKWLEIYRSQPIANTEPSHGGGGKLFLWNHKLYFTIGYPDYVGYPNETIKSTEPNTQNKTNSFGKIFEFDLNKKIPTLLSIGHRNPQGLAVTGDGSIVSVEHGPQGGDELNLIKKGSNYGWPYVSYGTVYGRYANNFNKGSEDEKLKKYTDPIFAFVPSVGASSVIYLEGFNAKWKGDLLIGSLKAQTLFRLHLGESNRVVYSEPIWVGHRIRDISEFKNNIVLLTDDSQLIFLSVDNESLINDRKSDGLYLNDNLKKCLTCHSFQQSAPTSSAPSLLNIINRKIGSDSYEHYSEAIKNKTGIWDEESLHAFIKDPQSVIPGTVMPNLGLSDNEISKIIKSLQ